MDVKWKKRKKARAIEVFREIEIRKTKQNKKNGLKANHASKAGQRPWLVVASQNAERGLNGVVVIGRQSCRENVEENENALSLANQE